MSATGAALPIVLVPVGSDEDALDACLAALDAATPAGTRVWLADDAAAGPRGLAIIAAWLASTRCNAAHTRRAQPLGDAAHVGEALRACGAADVAVLAADARPVPGWLQHLAACLAGDPAIASATPWCNAGETAAWPRLGEVVPLAHAPGALADAAARLAAGHPTLPAAVGHAVALRGAARVAAGGVDAASFRSWPAALVDLSLRMAGHGHRNVLCETAFVLRDAESLPAEGDMDSLAARWPSWNAAIARFLMQDPLHGLREELATALRMASQPARQSDLFTATT